MPSLVGAEWMALDPSLWRVRVNLPSDPAEELWRARLRRRRNDAASVVEEPQPAFAPFFGEAAWRKSAETDEALIFEPDGSLRWTLPFPDPATLVFPLRPSVRLWVQEVLPDGRLWHAYFADHSAPDEARSPLKALAALIDALPQPVEPAPEPSDISAEPPLDAAADRREPAWGHRLRARRAPQQSERAQAPSVEGSGLDPALDPEAAQFAAEFLLPNPEADA